MSGLDVAAIITSVGTLLTSIGTLVAVMKVQRQTNGMSIELREVSRKAGVITGRAQEKAAHSKKSVQ